MAVQVGNKYACSFCEKLYADPSKADACRDSHNLVYIPFTRDEVNRLLQFIFMKDDALLTESVVKRLKKGVRNFVTKG